jgi:radical SAM superfamily enzyme YgiQ (UPF0313 family)
MANYCRANGLEVRIIDAEAEEISASEVAERVQELNPTLTAIVVYGHQPSASTQIMTSAGEVASAIKQKSSAYPILMLGGHVAALPEQTLREEEIDFVATGEGVQALVDVCVALQTANPNWAQVPGIYYRDGGSLRRTMDRPLLRDLDHTLPGVSWDLLPMDRYRAHNWHCLGQKSRQPYAALYTTLGCPFHCSFCCIQAPFKDGEKAAGMSGTANSYRFWSPDHVVSQIDLLVNQYGVRNIKIADEMFVLNRRHVEGICDRLIERKYDLNIWAYTRVDTIKDGMLPKLRRAGVTWLAVGIESGADAVRAGVDKSIGQEAIFTIVEQIRSEGIHVIGNYIFGLPKDSQESMQQTLQLAQDLNCEFSNFYSAMAYPGSPLFQQAKRFGVSLPAKWSGYSQHSYDCLPLPTEHLTAKEVLRFRDSAFNTFYTSENYLRHIATTFGADTVTELQDMTKTTLRRGLLEGTLDVSDRLLPTDSATNPSDRIERLALLTT